MSRASAIQLLPGVNYYERRIALRRNVRLAVDQVGAMTVQALAERGEAALEHGAYDVGRAAADLLTQALDRRVAPGPL